MGSVYDIGDRPRVTATFTDTGGDNADPDTVVFHVETPDGTVTTQTHSASTGDIVKQGTGVYYLDRTTTSSGPYWFRVTSTGTVVASEEHTFRVSERRVTT